MSLFSFLKKESKTIMVFHDDGLQLMQFEESGEKIRMLGYNELVPTAGILENSNIVNMDSFEMVLEGLFTQAQPDAIKTRELYVNVPYRLLYTFVEDSSHKASESTLKESILETVKKHYPVPLEDLVLDFDYAEKGHSVSFSACGWPKKWEERFLKACKTVGVSSVHFIPEPLCQKALHSEDMQEDFALFSCHGKQVYLSLFHNGLLYDSYFLDEICSEELVDCVDCYAEFGRAQKDFEGRFSTTIQSVFFVGFDKKYQKGIHDSFDASGFEINFLEPKNSKLRELLPYEIDKSTIFGLFNISTSYEK